jgi:xanthine/CO dehydrogenase XdhC/CoxF family maturation factor
LVRPFVLILFLAVHVGGQSLEEAVREIARNVLAPGEAPHVTERNISEGSRAPEFAAETTRARTLLERALRRPALRDARIVEVVVTATENISGPLLVV